ncbi:MAG: glycosyl hydrolase [Chitinophagaceae bacterium]
MSKNRNLYFFFFLLCCAQVGFSWAQVKKTDAIEQAFLNPPPSAKPWVFWYWMHAAVSKAGITADLEAMKEVGIGGAYLMPIQDTVPTIPFAPTVRQLTPEWWGMVNFAMQEAKRLGLKLAMHVSDGFALAGGPWITAELSMQKLVWTKTYLNADIPASIHLARPEAYESYYKDVAVYAYPERFKTDRLLPEVTSSQGTMPQFLATADKANKQSFKSDTTCWVQYQYQQPFTCRSVSIHTGGNNYQAQRLIIQTSDDGIHFSTITRLVPPRHGWQDTDEDVTSAIAATTSRYFRFLYDKDGTEPGAEDLDAAKWKPSLKVMGIYLSSEPVINQYESKNGSVWRISNNTTNAQVPENMAIPLSDVINLSDKMDAAGNLRWVLPAGNWVVVRMGHTSTGHTNATGGAGAGLECDKFNAAAIKLQFDSWFGKAFEKTDPALAREVLKVFHVDSWEAGSQNWSPVFAGEFKKRRGYDLMPYLLTMAGIPLVDAATSEKVLHDVRQTIAELVNDVFYVTLNKLAHEKGCSFSAESVAPTMVSDGLLHYKTVDLPMGEFWLNSPTHDKPNDMLDAISGAHIYGKNIIQAESFTSVRMNWGEHPGNLKALGDRNFALGINKMVLHVFAHNPFMDRKPGVTLDGVGLYFQRDQTWFKQGKAWIDYLARCQALLQLGMPVVDVAVFTGEEIPRRSVLPDRIVGTLPGIFGKHRVASEKKRLENKGEPMRQIPDGVSHSANMADPENWVNPLNGYAYDSFNPDALMLMRVEKGRVVLPGGANYGVLVFPEQTAMQPNAGLVSMAVLKKIAQLVNDGATVLMTKSYIQGIGFNDRDEDVIQLMRQLLTNKSAKGKILFLPYTYTSFLQVGLPRDLEFLQDKNDIAWTHRKTADADIYFIANQRQTRRSIVASFRIADKLPEIWDPVSLEKKSSHNCWNEPGRTRINLYLEPNQSVFVIFRKPETRIAEVRSGKIVVPLKVVKGSLKIISDNWTVQFDKSYGGPVAPVIFNTLKSWTESNDPAIRYYSGTAVYTRTFDAGKVHISSAYLQFDSINDIATIKVNGIDCGTLWTKPFKIDITKAIKPGNNLVEISVSNTWHNRLIGDQLLDPAKRVTWTTAPFRLKDKPLLPAGLTGDIHLKMLREE